MNAYAAAWPSLYKIGPSHIPAVTAKPAPERDCIARLPSQLILGVRGGPAPLTRQRQRLGWQVKTQGSAPRIGLELFPRAPCNFLCNDPGIPESLHPAPGESSYTILRQAWPQLEKERTYIRSLYTVNVF